MAQTQTQQAQATVISAEHRFFYKQDGAVYHGCSVRQADGTMRRAEQAPQMTVAKIKQFVAMITRKDGTLYNGRPETVYGGPGKRIVANGIVYLVPNRLLEHYQQITDAEQAGRAPSDKWPGRIRSRPTPASTRTLCSSAPSPLPLRTPSPAAGRSRRPDRARRAATPPSR